MAKAGRKQAGRPIFRTLEVIGSSKRACGTCVACCIPYAIPDLDKPAHVPCPHLAPEGGCGCYDTRPATCRGFQCLWLKDLLPEAMRPLEVGYIVATNFAGSFVQVNEMRPNATRDCPHFAAWADEVRLRGIEIHIVPAGG